MENMTIGQRIASRRKLANLSQESISEQIGVSRQSVSKWESDAGLPDIDNLIALSKIFGVSVGWLLGTEQDPSFDPSTGLSDAQLRMVEKVVAGRKAKRWYGYLAAGLATCILASSVLLSCALAQVKNENRAAQQQISMLEDRIDSMNTILLQQKKERELLLNTYTMARMNEDGQTVTVDFYLIPKLFQENTQAYVTVRNQNGGIWLQLECSPMGNWYHCRAELPAENGYLYSFILAGDSGFQEQELNDYVFQRYLQNLYDATRYHLDVGAEKRIDWSIQETQYTFRQPIASPFVNYLSATVGYEAIDVTLYHNEKMIYTQSLRQAFRELGGARMVSVDPLIPDIRVELPMLAEGDELRLEITSKDYEGNVLTNTLEKLKVVSIRDGEK